MRILANPQGFSPNCAVGIFTKTRRAVHLSGNTQGTNWKENERRPRALFGLAGGMSAIFLRASVYIQHRSTGRMSLRTTFDKTLPNTESMWLLMIVLYIRQNGGRRFALSVSSIISFRPWLSPATPVFLQIGVELSFDHFLISNCRGFHIRSLPLASLPPRYL